MNLKEALSQLTEENYLLLGKENLPISSYHNECGDSLYTLNEVFEFLINNDKWEVLDKEDHSAEIIS